MLYLCIPLQRLFWEPGAFFEPADGQADRDGGMCVDLYHSVEFFAVTKTIVRPGVGADRRGLLWDLFVPYFIADRLQRLYDAATGRGHPSPVVGGQGDRPFVGAGFVNRAGLRYFFWSRAAHDPAG